MSDYATDLAEQAADVVRQKIAGQTPRFRARVLTQAVREISRMAAQDTGHEDMARLHASLVREHQEQQARKGVMRGRGGR